MAASKKSKTKPQAAPADRKVAKKADAAARSAKRYTVKRVYEAPAKEDGLRVLVDRLWPRGLSKAGAEIDLWLRDLSPSDGLRKEFHAKPEKWAAFVKAYAGELKGEAAQAALTELRAAKAPVITLLYAAKDEAKNNAVALKAWLER